MNAETLRCQSCGAAVRSDAPTCAHCGARLAAIACPTCFGMMFLGQKFCPHCGGVAAQWQSGDGELPCPVCEVPMLRGTVGPATLHECGRCFGLWLDTVTFERLCRDAEQQAAVLAASTTLGQPCVTNLEPVRYRRCPVCRDVMNRVNFARCSGVVVDACRTHGTWFDRDELHRIVEFIRAGGLGVAREKQMAAWAEESRRLESARREEVRDEWRGRRSPDLLSMVVGSSRGLLGRWIER